MVPITLLDKRQLELTLHRLAWQIVENHQDLGNTAILGLQPRGTYLANRVAAIVKEISQTEIHLGALDITFHRDDFRRRDTPIHPNKTEINFLIEDKDLILADDVLYTGRSVRAGLDAMLAFGRPKSVELMCLIDRRFHRDLPIQPNYVGKQVDSIVEERVSVQWKEVEGEDKVVLFIPNKGV